MVRVRLSCGLFLATASLVAVGLPRTAAVELAPTSSALEFPGSGAATFDELGIEARALSVDVIDGIELHNTVATNIPVRLDPRVVASATDRYVVDLAVRVDFSPESIAGEYLLSASLDGYAFAQGSLTLLDGEIVTRSVDRVKGKRQQSDPTPRSAIARFGNYLRSASERPDAAVLKVKLETLSGDQPVLAVLNPSQSSISVTSIPLDPIEIALPGQASSYIEDGHSVVELPATVSVAQGRTADVVIHVVARSDEVAIEQSAESFARLVGTRNLTVRLRSPLATAGPVEVEIWALSDYNHAVVEMTVDFRPGPLRTGRWRAAASTIGSGLIVLVPLSWFLNDQRRRSIRRSDTKGVPRRSGSVD